jgi:CheY-like chemotaxis protein
METIKNTVMLVDDSPANLKILSAVLKGSYNLMIAKGGKKTLEIIDSGKMPDLILLDIIMPDLDGYSVCKLLKSSEKTRDIPIIFISAMNQSGDEEKGLKLGAVDYITKPFVPSIVLTRVDTQLKLSHSMHEIKRMYSKSIELNRELSSKNSHINLILNNSGEGFLVIESDFKVHSEHSRECDSIFGFDVYEKDFEALFRDFNGIKIEEDFEILKELFDIPYELMKKKSHIYLSLMSEEIEKAGRCYKVRYSLIKADNDYERKILIVLKDITEEKHLEQKLVDEHRLLLMIVNVVSNIEDYKNLIINTFFFFGNSFEKKIKTFTSQNLHFLFRMTHTFKGEFGRLNIMDMVEKLDALETMLSIKIESKTAFNYEDFHKKYSEIELLNCLEKTNLIVEQYSGRNVLLEDDQNDFLTVNKRLIYNFENMLYNSPDKIDKSVILDNLKKLEYKSLHGMLYAYCEYSKTLAADLGKEKVKVVITGEDIFLDPVKYGNMLKSLIHIFRNMVDHGIEPADERHKKGKDIQGTISCHIEKDDNSVELTIEDDGKGLDMDILKDRVQNTFNIPSEKMAVLCKKDLLQYLFEMNISTKCTRTLVSGRGVGLFAVKSELKRINGTIEVDSWKDRGTQFIIKFHI